MSQGLSATQDKRHRWIQQVLPVGLNTPLATGKFNLLGETNLFLKLEDAGTYVIEEDEASGAKGTLPDRTLYGKPPQKLSIPAISVAGESLGN